MKTWLKFALVGLANVLLGGLGLMMLLFSPVIAIHINIMPILLIMFCFAFAAEGIVLYRLTSQSGKCKYLWATILTYVLLSVAVLVYLLIAHAGGPHAAGQGIVWFIIAVFALAALIFTIITCLTVWIIQIIKSKKLKRND